MIFYKEVKNIKQSLINNGFPKYIVDEQIKLMIKNVNQQNKYCTTPTSQQIFIKFEHQNNKQKLQILEVIHIRNIQPKLNRITFKTSANVLNVFSNWRYL